jgi:N-acetylmuramoyl-L-alanine amidase
MNWRYWEWAILSLMIWREARNQGLEGMKAVGHVANNRARAARKSIALIICEDAQFTSINPPKKSYDSQLDVWPLPDDLFFQQAMAIANEILDGASVDPTGGATFYWNPKTASSPWFDRVVANGPAYEKSLVLRDHEFFREKARVDRA